MSSVDSSATGPSARRRSEPALTFGVFAAVLAAMLPVMRVVSPDAWVWGCVLVVGAVLASGFAARRVQLPAVAVSLIEAGVWLVLMTLIFLRETALLGIIPTPETVRLVQALLPTAFAEVAQGAAPLPATLAMSFLLVGAVGLLAIVIDHVVLTARMPLLAAVGLIPISLIPAIAVPDEADVWAFVLLSASLLLMMRAEMRAREARVPRVARGQDATGAAPRSAVSASALGVGAVAVIVALVIVPLLPAPTGSIAGGAGVGTAIDPTLQLGDDLRKPQEVEVLRVRGTGTTAPYLRVATLSQFDGQVWEPDRGRPVSLDDAAALVPDQVAEGIEVIEVDTTVEVQNLRSSWLPVSYPAVEVSGLGPEWSALPENRTVISRSATSAGETYDIQTRVPQPSLEQVRATRAGGIDDDGVTLALPADMPSVIAERANEVTAGAATDYDKLKALQDWFRSSEFSYSLDAPVADGFDGTGADAVAEFLQQREGYCVHYASAFALMARSLDMPTRIVVGYLPGTTTGDEVDDQRVYSVQSGQLHAWPETYFEGIGWIGFEPTNSLGVPTSFASTATGGSPGADADVAPEATPGASAAPSASSSARPDEEALNGSAAGSGTGASPLPTMLVLSGILVALLIPGLLAALRRRVLHSRSRRGDVLAAWTSIQDIAIDIGIPAPASESARMFGHRLVAQHGAPAAELNVLLREIEKASYAQDGTFTSDRGAELADATASVRAGMLGAVDPPRRVLAAIAPRSLLIRPGSAFAESGGTLRAR
ncbi:transglutaminaseTgpA domain-containing protein [Microbacterium sp. P03]|uniref:transglutaminase family protein n=1 Tax=Microbacterium sp. P03 TaxID=3366946 RepID=UPI003747615B